VTGLWDWDYLIRDKHEKIKKQNSQLSKYSGMKLKKKSINKRIKKQNK
jgi:hypothetical protein